MIDSESTKMLSDEQLLARLQEFGDTNYKAVTMKNRLIMEKKLNHHLARELKREKEAKEKEKAANKTRSPRRGRPASPSRSFSKISFSNAHGTTEFSDSDIDRSPSRNRRSSRQKVAAVNTSYNLDETAEPQLTTRSPNTSLNRSRRSFGANTSYNLDETVYDPPEPYNRQERSMDRGSLSRFEVRTPKDVDEDLSFETSNVLPEIASTGRISVRERRMQSGRASRVDSEHSRSTLANSDTQFGSSRDSAINPSVATSKDYHYSSKSTSSKGAPTRTSSPTFQPSSWWNRALTITCVLVIFVSIGAALYFYRPCIGDHCATFTKIEDRLKTIAKSAAIVNGKHQCGDKESPYLRVIDMTFDPDPIAVLKFGLQQSNLSFQILDDSGREVHDDSEILESCKVLSSVALKSLPCRIKQSLTMVTQALLYLILGVFGVIGMLITLRVYVYNRKKEAKMVTELVEGILEMVKQQAHKNPPYIPIAHVRDTLLALPSQNSGGIKGRCKRWAKAIHSLGLSESRLRTENQIIKGEEHLVWRWVSITYYASGGSPSTGRTSTSKTTSSSNYVTNNAARMRHIERSPSAERGGPKSLLTSGSEAESAEVQSVESSRVPSRESRAPSRVDNGFETGDSAAGSRPRSRSDSRGRRSIKLGPGSGWSNYERSAVEIIPPTQCLKLKDLALECTGNAGLDAAKQSVISRLHQYAYQVYSVDYDHKSEESAVYICCMDKAQAADIYRVFYEQEYNGEKVQVKFLKLDKYLERFPYLRNVVISAPN